MQAIYLHSALCNHMSCDGAVYSARKKQKPAPRGAYGHTVGALYELIEHKRLAVFAHIDIDYKVGAVHVHFQLFALIEQPAADFRADCGRIKVKSLVRAVCFHLERAAFIADGLCGGEDFIHIRIDLIPYAERMYAEHL